MLEASIMGQFCDPNVIFLEGVVTKSESVEIKIILSVVGLNGNASSHYMYTQRIARLNPVEFHSLNVSIDISVFFSSDSIHWSNKLGKFKRFKDSNQMHCNHHLWVRLRRV